MTREGIIELFQIKTDEWLLNKEIDGGEPFLTDWDIATIILENLPVKADRRLIYDLEIGGYGVISEGVFRPYIFIICNQAKQTYTEQMVKDLRRFILDYMIIYKKPIDYYAVMQWKPTL